MRPRFIVSESYFDFATGEIISTEVKRFISFDEALAFYRDNNDRDNLTLTYDHPDGNVRTWDETFQEWDVEF